MVPGKSYLRILSGPLVGGVLVLEDRRVFYLGSSQECALTLPDRSLEPRHACIRRDDTAWKIVDLSRARVLRVNDIPTDERLLVGGEILRLGETEVQFTFRRPRGARDSSSDSSPYLEVVDGLAEDIGRRIELKPGMGFTIGRSVQAELPLLDCKASRRHCQVTVDEAGAITITDLRSLNGTRLNGLETTEAVIHEGDEISIGRSLLCCRAREFTSIGA